MIALIKGNVVDKAERYLTVLTPGGVGYKVGVKSETFAKVKVDQEIGLYIYSHIREDAFDLFGFENKEDLHLFEMLLSVSGVGPKTALLVISSGTAGAITDAISKGDTGFFTDVPGIGTKGAQRIIVDLRSKVGALGDFDLSEEESSEKKQIVEALRGFGFKEAEARQAVRFLPKDSSLTLEQKIRSALKSLSR